MTQHTSFPSPTKEEPATYPSCSAKPAEKRAGLNCAAEPPWRTFTYFQPTTKLPPSYEAFANQRAAIFGRLTSIREDDAPIPCVSNKRLEMRAVRWQQIDPAQLAIGNNF
ncbi:hypothetical protein T440DRAFT_535847 [Plenodomus tracheiphilus IPT5]|uniref:Uncharacterized protein n=1 Tax=Plenodomus tracheiphilus IPT5 TaxID=1408161 RepID=A0A6A7BMI0_9PLEO|nr:hypothetical protein T440DRAFT_535847 [Plenodomus tracheiphilus IPT5]